MNPRNEGASFSRVKCCCSQDGRFPAVPAGPTQALPEYLHGLLFAGPQEAAGRGRKVPARAWRRKSKSSPCQGAGAAGPLRDLPAPGTQRAPLGPRPSTEPLGAPPTFPESRPARDPFRYLRGSRAGWRRGQGRPGARRRAAAARPTSRRRRSGRGGKRDWRGRGLGGGAQGLVCGRSLGRGLAGRASAGSAPPRVPARLHTRPRGPPAASARRAGWPPWHRGRTWGRGVQPDSPLQPRPSSPPLPSVLTASRGPAAARELNNPGEGCPFLPLFPPNRLK